MTILANLGRGLLRHDQYMNWIRDGYGQHYGKKHPADGLDTVEVKDRMNAVNRLYKNRGQSTREAGTRNK